QHAHGLPRVPSKVVVSVIGSSETYWDTVVRFADTQKLDFEALARLSYAIDARYLVFGRIEYAEIYDTPQPFNHLTDANPDSLRPRCAPARDIPQGTGLSTDDSLPPADFSANNCSTSQAIAFVTVVDARTGTAPWTAKHHIDRNVGNSRVESNPAPLV